MVDRIGIFGASGCGKSTVLRAMIETRPRVVFLDPMGEARDWKGWQTVTLASLRRALTASPAAYRIAVEPRPGSEAADLDRVAAILRDGQRHYQRHGLGVCLAADELNLSFPTAGGAERAPAFADLCSRGRHAGVTLIGASQRVAEVSTRFRGNLNVAVVGRVKGAADRQAAADMLDVDRNRVATLENFAFLVERGGTVKPYRTTPAGKFEPG